MTSAPILLQRSRKTVPRAARGAATSRARPCVLAYVLLTLPVAAIAQNNGLPSQQQTAVVMELIADRGEACERLRPWQAASIRMQTRDLIAGFNATAQLRVQREIEARRAAMRCDDPLLAQWTAAALPRMEQELLPEMLAGYRAAALHEPRLASFDSATGRNDYTIALQRIDAKLAQLIASGARLPGGMSLDSLHRRQVAYIRQFAAAMSDSVPGRYTAAQARRILADAARVGELWLKDEGIE